jgi:hypothetical protein
MQVERNIHQLQLSGDSVAAAALQRKIERPSLAGSFSTRIH